MTQKNNWQQRNEAYNRERQVMDDWAKKDIELDKVLTEVYKEGAKRIQSRIDGFYMRYAQKEGLTLAEAKKAADLFDVKLWEQDAAKAVADKDFSPYANQWLRLYNLKMKVARDELLKRELELEISKLTNQVETQMNIARMDAAMKEFERQANILGGSTGTPQRLKSVLNANFYGKNFSERVWGNGGLYHQMQKQVFKSISNIMTDMDGYRKERNRLANVMGAKKHEAVRLLKTEMARIRSDVDLAKYKENGFTHYVFVCEPNPCKICVEYDNQVFEVSKGMTTITMPPLHPNCRCSTYGRVELPDKKSLEFGLDSHDDSTDFRISYSHEDVPEIGRNVDGKMRTISVKRVNGISYDGEMYLSNAVKAGKKNAITYYSKKLVKALELIPNIPASFNLPRVVIVDKTETSPNVVAGYVREGNTLFVRSDLRTDDDIVNFQSLVPGELVAAYNPLSTIIHEFAHWYQWEEVSKRYPNLGNKELAQIIFDESMELVANLERKGYNIGERISRYASRSSHRNPMETFAEKFTKDILESGWEE